MGARYCLDLHHYLWSSVTTWHFVIKNTLLFNLLFLFQTLMDDLAKDLDARKGKESILLSQNAAGWDMDSFVPHTTGGNTIF